MAAKKDRIKGMLWAVAYGDALGAPYEFDRHAPSEKEIEIKAFTVPRRLREAKRLPEGSVTDDTQMTLACASALAGLPDTAKVRRKEDMEPFIVNYMHWASHCLAIGDNTRRLLKGIKTMKGFWNRQRRFFGKAAERENVKPNGALMRCSPFAVLDFEPMLRLSELDCRLTNPNQTSVDSNHVYLQTLHRLLRGTPLVVAAESAFEFQYVEEVRAVAENGWSTDDPRPEVGNGKIKGLVLNSLWCAFRALRIYDRLVREKRSKPFDKTLRHIIALPGNTDTDTNAAIAGALLGAAAGYRSLVAVPEVRGRLAAIRESDGGGEEQREPHARGEHCFDLSLLTDDLVARLERQSKNSHKR